MRKNKVWWNEKENGYLGLLWINVYVKYLNKIIYINIVIKIFVKKDFYLCEYLLKNYFFIDFVLEVF